MQYVDRISACGLIPVVVIEDPKRAVPTARALIAGGLDVMEITFRTESAAESIREVSTSCPEMLVGAGTIVTIEQCKNAVQSGAKFIVSPGINEEVIAWCIENKVAIFPGCATPSEIMTAMRYGLKVLKFFPASVYGGLNGIKALAGPFGDITFIPTGGVNADNIGEYTASPYVSAVGGSWVCSKKDISAGNYDNITRLCREARRLALGFEVCHVGINCADGESAEKLCECFDDAFDFWIKTGNSSIFVSENIEVMKTNARGEKGHLAIKTNNVSMAVSELEKRGFEFDLTSAKYAGNRMTVIYLKKEFGGFGVHLLQR